MAKKDSTEEIRENIIRTEFSEEMSKSYIDYSMSVIVARALPDARDGLKPVQRRVIYAMKELGNSHDKPHRKCARIVGDTMGKYHPHGDSSIYECLVNMAQSFKRTVPLVDGHGNFGSIEGDGAAAMRYTEARLQEITEEVFLEDIDKDTVDFIPNFDETEKEPRVLPAMIPNLLVSGAEGIAVGMATNIPTHNLGEVLNAEIAFLKDPSLSTAELMFELKGPDWPTGGIIINGSDLWSIYETGSGKIKVRAKIDYVPADKKSGKDRLIISEIPPTMVGSNLPALFSDLASLAAGRLLSDVSDISNQSDKNGIRIVFELKKGADPEKLMNLLYRKTKLENTYGVNMLAIDKGRPVTMSLPAILRCHTDFMIELTTRKYTSLLKREQDRLEVQEGLIRAVDIIDLIIEILRGSPNVKEAKACLMGQPAKVTFKSEESKKLAEELHFTEKQAQAILDLRLARLIGLEILALQKEYKETKKKIARYRKILGSEAEKRAVCIEELTRIRDKYSVPRRTLITDREQAHDVVEEVKEQEVVFSMDRFGYSRILDLPVYERNKDSVDKDSVWLFRCLNTDRVRVFTDTGQVHQVKVADIPLVKAKEKGIPIDNLCNYDSSVESFIYVCPAAGSAGSKLLFCTKQGYVKVVPSAEFDSSKRTVLATKLSDGDRLVCVTPQTDSQVVLRTQNGFFLRFPVSEISELKKNSIGVKGITLGEDDFVKACVAVQPNKDSMVPCAGGAAVEATRIRLGKRAGKGVRLKL